MLPFVCSNRTRAEPALLSTKVYDCKICSTRVESIEDFMVHYKMHTYTDLSPTNFDVDSVVIKLDRCVKCGEVTEDIKKHAATHKKIRKRVSVRLFDCKICTERFESLNVFKEHYKTHLDDPDVETSAKFEIAEAADVQWRCYRCNIITKNLKLHLKKHGFPRICEKCGKMIGSGTSWIRHRREHAGINLKERNATCEKCGKTFSQDGLRQHLIYHSDRRPHVCEVCGKAFKTSLQLRLHKYIHDGIKPYTCQFCGKGFRKRYNLSGHLRTHTGEKPFRCKQCPESFTHNVSLKTHMKKAHGIDLWKSPLEESTDSHDDKTTTNNPISAMNPISTNTPISSTMNTFISTTPNPQISTPKPTTSVPSTTTTGTGNSSTNVSGHTTEAKDSYTPPGMYMYMGSRNLPHMMGGVNPMQSAPNFSSLDQSPVRREPGFSMSRLLMGNYFDNVASQGNDVVSVPFESGLKTPSHDSQFVQLPRKLDESHDSHTHHSARELDSSHDSHHLQRDLESHGSSHLPRELESHGSGHVPRELESHDSSHLPRELQSHDPSHLQRELDQSQSSQVLSHDIQHLSRDLVSRNSQLVQMPRELQPHGSQDELSIQRKLESL